MKILEHLPRGYLYSVSGVSRILHDLSVPLLFQNFRFHPGALVEGHTSTSGTPIRRELDRLAF
ncbi:hypothetical protein B0H19DRAFT_1087917 [Mycena capillaripes]|nr:hypothetical protein B0H19DRAFT_1087917 [Mycena capillaripes]